MKRWLSIGLFSFFINCLSLLAGDGATFVNLGFSEDSRYFMFAQYGITDLVTDKSRQAYADLFIVDVPSNSFAPKGKLSEKYNLLPEAGQNPLGALLNLNQKHSSIISSFKINHLKTGRFLYILIDGQKPLANLEFRDFLTNNLYNISLIQNKKGSGNSVSASFIIQLTITDKNGKKINTIIGKKDYFRPLVLEYQIKYIILAPDAKSLVFVIEKKVQTEAGEDIRYMVETFRNTTSN